MLARSFSINTLLSLILLGSLTVSWSPTACLGQDGLDEAPVSYRETRGDNPVSRLMQQLNLGEVTLEYDQKSGYLTGILEALDIPVESQVLVFSKTSLQSGRISPSNPRAIYFNDEVYVGWVHDSSLLEISAADPKLGAAFYTMRMYPRRASLRRENGTCLACHQVTTDDGQVSAHTIRSVMTRSSGKINLLLDEYLIDHSSPMEHRWGGWYVTGDLGDTAHQGNAFLQGEDLVSIGPSTAKTLSKIMDIDEWPTPSSDAVALMVMEHQTSMQNEFTRADFAVRRAKHTQSNASEGLRRELDQVVDRSARRVVEHLLFANEASLDDTIKGSTNFASVFTARGARDDQGRSLREFDLQTRLFRYPCSYLITSPIFDALDVDLRNEIGRQLAAVLSGKDQSPPYAHLDQTTRTAIAEILQSVKPSVMAWRTRPVANASR